MLVLTTNIASPALLLYPKNQISTHGLIRNLRLVQNHAAVDINREMSRVLSKELFKKLMQACATHPQNPPNGKSVEPLIAHRIGLKENGANVQHHVAKMVLEKGKFIAKKLAQTGNKKIFSKS